MRSSLGFAAKIVLSVGIAFSVGFTGAIVYSAVASGVCERQGGTPTYHELSGKLGWNPNLILTGCHKP